LNGTSVTQVVNGTSVTQAIEQVWRGVEVWRCGGKLVRGQYYSKRNSKRL